MMHGAKQGNCAGGPRRIGTAIFAGCLLLATLPFPASARSTTVDARADNLTATGDAAPAEAVPARVIFGRALDLDGQRPVQAYPPVQAFQKPSEMTSASPGVARGRSSARITSGFGMRQHPILGGRRAHLGVDMAAPTGSPILSPDAATVQAAGWQGGYGLMVTLLHGNGMVTRYAHLSRIAVAPGQRIGKGAVIGLVGSTGRSTGAHLHYETWVNGQPVNPLGR